MNVKKYLRNKKNIVYFVFIIFFDIFFNNKINGARKKQ